MSDEKQEKPSRGPRKPKYILQMTDAETWLPNSVGEMLWRAKVNEPFVIFCDEADHAKTARLIKSYEWRLRNESGIDFRVTTQQAMLVYTDNRAMAHEEAATGRPSTRPIDVVKRMLIVTVLGNPVAQAWKEKYESSELAEENLDDVEGGRPKRGRGRPRKSEASGEDHVASTPTAEAEPKKRGRARKESSAASGQLDLEPEK